MLADIYKNKWIWMLLRGALLAGILFHSLVFFTINKFYPSAVQIILWNYWSRGYLAECLQRQFLEDVQEFLFWQYTASLFDS